MVNLVSKKPRKKPRCEKCGRFASKETLNEEDGFCNECSSIADETMVAEGLLPDSDGVFTTNPQEGID